MVSINAGEAGDGKPFNADAGADGRHTGNRMKFPVYTRTIGDVTAWGGCRPQRPATMGGGRGGEMVKTLLNWLKGLLGYPMPPRPEQVGEALVTMREARDCHVAAIATACGVSYEQAHKATGHRNLPGFLESPIYSNPKALVAAIERLGCQVKSLKISELLHGEMPAGKVICLVHNPTNAIAATLQSHWVVWLGIKNDKHQLAWGNSQTPVEKTSQEMIDLVTLGWPNCLIEVK